MNWILFAETLTTSETVGIWSTVEAIGVWVAAGLAFWVALQLKSQNEKLAKKQIEMQEREIKSNLFPVYFEYHDVLSKIGRISIVCSSKTNNTMDGVVWEKYISKIKDIEKKQEIKLFDIDFIFELSYMKAILPKTLFPVLNEMQDNITNISRRVNEGQDDDSKKESYMEEIKERFDAIFNAVNLLTDCIDVEFGLSDIVDPLEKLK